MDNKQAFQRNYLIFGQEDGGYGTGKNPSGYVKIEIRDGKGKLGCAVENLREDNNTIYSLQMMSVTDKGFSAADAGAFQLKKGAGEIKWEFDPKNVAQTGRVIDDFNVFAVIAGSKDARQRRISSPLTAYRGVKADWRSRAYDRLLSAAATISAAETRKDPAPAQYKQVESKFKPPETQPDFNIPEKAKERLPEVPDVSVPVTPAAERKPYLSDNEVIIKADNTGAQAGSESSGWSSQFAGLSAEEILSGIRKMDQCEMAKNGLCNSAAYTDNMLCAGCALQRQPGEQPAPAIQPETPKADTEQPAKKPDPDMNQSALEYRRYGANLTRLRNAMDRCFERYDPFGSKRKDYAWWKVNSPVNLNNVLYQCNIKTPLLFNPALMMSHFKYRHLIAGIYSDRERDMEYIVCGVPGVYSIDDRPFGDLCRWAQLEGAKPKYGAFGYWLVYIDPVTGKFLNVR